ncbi:MAG: hypothetical protein V3W19_02740 [Desulfatiglandales bacterium]
MAIIIDNSWPLMVVSPAKESALQKQSATPPSKDPQDSVFLDNGIELESDTFLEKGAFIDVYG